MSWLCAFVGAVLLMTQVGCQRPTEADCERICWKAAELAYQKQTAERLEKAPDEDAKKAIREEAEKGWQEIKDMPTNPELIRCSVSCQKDGRPKQVKCIDEAKTHKEVKDCM